MTFTGTLIEDLMATVERAEQRAQRTRALPAERLTVESCSMEPWSSIMLVESLLVEPWFASVQENADYDSKFIGVA